MNTKETKLQTTSYEAPHCEVIEIQSEGPLLTASYDISGGATDGGDMGREMF